MIAWARKEYRYRGVRGNCVGLQIVRKALAEKSVCLVLHRRSVNIALTDSICDYTPPCIQPPSQERPLGALVHTFVSGPSYPRSGYEAGEDSNQREHKGVEAHDYSPCVSQPGLNTPNRACGRPSTRAFEPSKTTGLTMVGVESLHRRSIPSMCSSRSPSRTPRKTICQSALIYRQKTLNRFQDLAGAAGVSKKYRFSA